MDTLSKPFVRPHNPVPQINITRSGLGLPRRWSRDLPTIEEIIDSFMEFIGDAVKVAHNLSLIIPFKEYLEKPERPYPEIWFWGSTPE